jgi:methionyl aminopeptidase
MPLRHGMVLAIEPLVIAGGRDGTYTAGDGRPVRTADGSRASHAEHTVAITDGGPRILTAP